VFKIHEGGNNIANIGYYNTLSDPKIDHIRKIRALFLPIMYVQHANVIDLII